MSSSAVPNTPRIHRCPSCASRVKWSSGNPYRPFCSDRCRTLDLGDWAGETNRIPGHSFQDDLLSGQLDPGEFSD